MVYSYDYDKKQPVWKKVLGVQSNKLSAVRVNVSQTGRMKDNFLDVTLDHKFYTYQDRKLIKNGQVLYFFHGRVFKNEQAEIVASRNKLKYKGDGNLYSISGLAKMIDKKLGLKHHDYGVAGPRYWQTDDCKLLHNLNEIVRRK